MLIKRDPDRDGRMTALTVAIVVFTVITLVLTLKGVLKW